LLCGQTNKALDKNLGQDALYYLQLI